VLSRRDGAGRRSRRCRGQGRRLGKQVQVQDDEPSDSIVDWVLEMLPQMGAGWCPPGMLGIGIGGTAEIACCSPSRA
jgi:tartrate dehydratase alpha subunit/fumarate hydratase class I-like protein